jgi:hypothetical protein
MSTHHHLTSPRLRGEVGIRTVRARIPGEGPYRQDVVLHGAPHPLPLPASGEREREVTS